MLPIQKYMCTLLKITYVSRNCTNLVLKLLVAKNSLSISVLCVAPFLQNIFFSTQGDYPPFVYTTQSIYIAALPFLINWNNKQCSESTILTMHHKFVLENCCSAAVNTLLNTIIYLKAVKYLNTILRLIY